MACRPPFTSCQTPLSKNELVGGHYAAGGADWAGGDNGEAEVAALAGPTDGAAEPASCGLEDGPAQMLADESEVAAPAVPAVGTGHMPAVPEEELSTEAGGCADVPSQAATDMGSEGPGPDAGSCGNRSGSAGAAGSECVEGGSEAAGQEAGLQPGSKRQKVACCPAPAPQGAALAEEQPAEELSNPAGSMPEGGLGLTALPSFAPQAAPCSPVSSAELQTDGTAPSPRQLAAASKPGPALVQEAGRLTAEAPAAVACNAVAVTERLASTDTAQAGTPSVPTVAASQVGITAAVEAQTSMLRSCSGGSSGASQAGNPACQVQARGPAVKEEEGQGRRQAMQQQRKRRLIGLEPEASAPASGVQERPGVPPATVSLTAGPQPSEPPPPPASEGQQAAAQLEPAAAPAAPQAPAASPALSPASWACTEVPPAPAPVPLAVALPTVAEEGTADRCSPGSPPGAGNSTVETPVAASAAQRRVQPFSPRPGGCSSTSTTAAFSPLLQMPLLPQQPVVSTIGQAALPLLPLPLPWQPAAVAPQARQHTRHAKQAQQGEQHGLPWKLRRRSAASMAATAAAAKEEEEEEEEGDKAPALASAMPGLAALPAAFLPAGLAAAGGTGSGLRPMFLMPFVPQGMQPCLPLAAGSKPGRWPGPAPATSQPQQQMAAYLRLMQMQALQVQAQAGTWPAQPLTMLPPLPMPLPLHVPAAEAAPQPLVQAVRPGDPIPPPPPLQWLLQSEPAVEAASVGLAAEAAAEASAAPETAEPVAEDPAEQQGEESVPRNKARGVKPPLSRLPPLPQPRPKPPPLQPPAPLPVIPDPLPPASEVRQRDGFKLGGLSCISPFSLHIARAAQSWFAARTLNTDSIAMRYA